MEKVNLDDVTFLMPIRIDSIVRMENIIIVVDYLLSHFSTSIIVLHADHYDNCILKRELGNNVKYIFKEDHDNVFHRTRYINEMVRLATTPYVAVWDVDVIVPSNQIENAMLKLREGYEVVYPFKHFLDTSSVIRELYLTTRDQDVLIRNCEKMKMIYGSSVKGGAFIINKSSYNKAGLENELFYGWGPEDGERYERWRQLEYKVDICEGYLFHLTHERGMNSGFRTINQNKLTHKLYYLTKSSSKEEVESRKLFLNR